MNFLTQTTATGGLGNSGMIFMLIGTFALMYFLTVRPQKKRQKEEQEMRNAVDVGDEITTIGGIMGRIVTVKEDRLIIETGTDKTKMTISRWSVQSNNTANERLAAQREAAKVAAEKAKAAKKKAKENKDVL